MDSNNSLRTSELSLPEDSLEALKALKHHPGYKVWVQEVLPFLEQSQEAALREQSDTTELFRAQGELRMLDKVRVVLHDLTSEGGE